MPCADLFQWGNMRTPGAVEQVTPNGVRLICDAQVLGLVIKSKQPCFHCHAVSALNPHRMDMNKVQSLIDVVELHRTNTWIRIEEGRGLRGEDTGKWKSTTY